MERNIIIIMKRNIIIIAIYLPRTIIIIHISFESSMAPSMTCSTNSTCSMESPYIELVRVASKPRDSPLGRSAALLFGTLIMWCCWR
uniref:Uncharacterized protein n=1 Tax=Triticum urartu TaxID=4572 RepID=A0A8R7TN65_TRIUA